MARELSVAINCPNKKKSGKYKKTWNCEWEYKTSFYAPEFIEKRKDMQFYITTQEFEGGEGEIPDTPEHNTENCMTHDCNFILFRLWMCGLNTRGDEELREEEKEEIFRIFANW